MSDSGYLFVAGIAPRSGTTFTAWLLNLHPEVHISYETHFPVCFHDLFMEGTGAQKDQRLWKTAYEHKWRLWDVPDTPDVTPLELARACCDGLRSAWEPIQWFGDKSPDYPNVWDKVEAVLPDCRVVVCHRSPCEIVESIRRQDWPVFEEQTDNDILHQIARGKKVMLEAANPMNVRLRDLNERPRLVLEGLMDWLNLDPSMYPWETALEQVHTRDDDKVN